MEWDDTGLDDLLNYHGAISYRTDGYWWKIEAWLIQPTVFCPHGVRYNLTLHNPSNRRILGYDNAHSIKIPAKSNFSNRIVRDHMHLTSQDKGRPYEYTTARKLMADFFTSVDEVINLLEGKNR
ncbi:DUF6516 family protein [Dryocola sp. LX212]|jgi:hypothetical protein